MTDNRKKIGSGRKKEARRDAVEFVVAASARGQ